MSKKDVNKVLETASENIKNQVNYYCDVTETIRTKDTINDFINKMEVKTAVLIKKGDKAVVFVYKSDEPIVILINSIQKFIADYSAKEIKVYKFAKK